MLISLHSDRQQSSLCVLNRVIKCLSQNPKKYTSSTLINICIKLFSFYFVLQFTGDCNGGIVNRKTFDIDILCSNRISYSLLQGFWTHFSYILSSMSILCLLHQSVKTRLMNIFSIFRVKHGFYHVMFMHVKKKHIFAFKKKMIYDW